MTERPEQTLKKKKKFWVVGSAATRVRERLRPRSYFSTAPGGVAREDT